jgi:RNA recognition motif-containing protein
MECVIYNDTLSSYFPVDAVLRRSPECSCAYADEELNSMATKLIVSNLPKSAKVSDLLKLFSQYCAISDVVINESFTTHKPWALITVEKAEPDVSDEDEVDENDDDDVDENDEDDVDEFNEPVLDDHSIDRLIDQLDGLLWRGKRLRVKRRSRRTFY